MTNMHYTTTRRSAGFRNGFTLIELLVVVTIIALLIGMTFAATKGALRAGAVSSTKFTMRSIATGIEQFKADFKYYPPLIRDDGQFDEPQRELLMAHNDPTAALIEFRYMSLTSLPVYLVGQGRLEDSVLVDGLRADRHDGVAGPGFRDPGPDRSWGGAHDRSEQNPVKSGRIYGPYIDAGSGDVMRPVRFIDFGSEPARKIPDPDTGALDDNVDKNMYVFVDAWDNPIRYYRPFWSKRDDTGSVSIEKTPIELINIEAVTGGFKPELDAVLNTSEYFLLSAGPDRLFTGTVTQLGGLDTAEQDLSLSAANGPGINATNSKLLEEIGSGSGGSAGDPVALKALLKHLKDNIRVTQ